MHDKIDEIIIAAALGVPAWLVLRAWYRYSALEPVPVGELLQIRTPLSDKSVLTRQSNSFELTHCFLTHCHGRTLI